MKDYIALSKKHFDSQAKDYDRKNTYYYSKYPKISCKSVSQKLSDISYQSLLDVGCGTGYLIDLLSKEKTANYYGLDLSPEMLRVARNKLSRSVVLTEGSADTLPYSDNSFDIVTCVQSFHHYPYPDKAMAEAYRVLKPGGLYILSDTGASGVLKWLENHIFLKTINSGDFAVYDIKDISKMMKANGFKITETEHLSRFIFTVIGKK